MVRVCICSFQKKRQTKNLAGKTKKKLFHPGIEPTRLSVLVLRLNVRLYRRRCGLSWQRCQRKGNLRSITLPDDYGGIEEGVECGDIEKIGHPSFFLNLLFRKNTTMVGSGSNVNGLRSSFTNNRTARQVHRPGSSWLEMPSRKCHVVKGKRKRTRFADTWQGPRNNNPAG